jgi:hypothetical protein
LVDRLGRVVGINTGILADRQSNWQDSRALVSADMIKFLNTHGIPFQLDNK